MSSSSLHVNKKLNAGNYHQWKFHVKLALMKEGLWRHVNSKAKAPASDSKTGSSELTKWEVDEENVFATLCLTISDSEMLHIQECTTAAEAWKKLADIYEAKGVVRELYLRK